MHDDRSKCIATSRSGRPCSAQPAPNSRFCRWHDPSEEATARRREWQRKGGHAKSTTNRLRKQIPQGLVDVEAALYRALTSLEDGTLEPAIANAMAGIARALVAIHEPGSLERRLADLERELGTRSRTASRQSAMTSSARDSTLSRSS